MDWEQVLAQLPPEMQQAIQGNADLLAAFKADPQGTAALLMADSSSAAPIDPSDPNWLAAQIQGSAMAVTGRAGLAANSHSVMDALPSWAKGLSQEVLSSNNFDPYLGIISQQGDERVYLGEARPKTTELPVSGVAAPSSDGADFLHGGQPTQDGGASNGKKVTEHGDKTYTATQVKNMPYLWDEKKIAETMKRMRAAGINVTTFDQGTNNLVDVWGALVDRAAKTYALSEGHNKVTPWDVLDLYKSEARKAGSYTNYQNGKEVSTTRNIADVGEGEAWSVLRDSLQQALGRDPSDQELRDYTYRMNQLAAANPSISKTITRYKNGEVVSQDTKNQDGFSAADMAKSAYEDAQNDPQHAEYQSATTYFNAALSALGAIGQVG